MSTKTLYWYDYETFGRDPRRDRVAQFAGLRTDENLNVIDEPLVLYCRPTDDFLPSPQACLVTGITPQEALEKGITEAAFIARIHAEFSRPNTCVAGYNSIRFDDEMTRQLLYRNFIDPYEREWKDGNTRWDIIDMVRLCAAVRPQGIAWPRGEDGNPSFRLEALTAANGITHTGAHDARADVLATIDMARLVRESQPRLYEYVYQLRTKKNVEQALDLTHRKPVIHVSAMYPAARGCLALVAPVCRHPQDQNGVLVYDLREDPESWIHADVEEIRQRLFTRNEDLPVGSRRIPLKTLHVNRCPVVAPAGILSAERAREYEIDLEKCNRHWQVLAGMKELAGKLRQALQSDRDDREQDPDYSIYSGGFFSTGDRKLMDVVRESSAQQLAMLNLPFRDRRLPEMLFRYRARNFPETLTDEERDRWMRFRRTRLDAGRWETFYGDLAEARDCCRSAEDRKVLTDLAAYAEQLKMDVTAP